MADEKRCTPSGKLTYEERLDRALERKPVGDDPDTEERLNTAMAVAIQQRDCACATCQFLRALEGQLYV